MAGNNPASPSNSNGPGTRWSHIPFLLPGMLALVAGVWGGLLRVPIQVPLPVEHSNWISQHGALMVCGFLGTLIGVERAVGLGRRWAWTPPVLTGAGALLSIGGASGQVALPFFLAGSLAFMAVTFWIWIRHPKLFTGLMFLAAIAWAGGNLRLLLGEPVATVVWWWAAFLGWTIIGERLELTRLIRLPRIAPVFLAGTIAVQAAALIVELWLPLAGQRLFAMCLMLEGAWLLRFDIARRTVRQHGLTRFTAICLLTGHAWLFISGLLLLINSPLIPGTTYDATLHAFFLGFVFSMIFGHAPIIFPSVLNLPIRFANRFYGHLVLLQLSLMLRVAADCLNWFEIRPWAAGFNALALAVFLMNTIASAVVGSKHCRVSNRTSTQPAHSAALPNPFSIRPHTPSGSE